MTATIAPITHAQERCVIQTTHDYIARANAHFGREFGAVPVAFDLKGQSAGMYRVQGQRRLIRYNPYIFAKDFTHGLTVTVPHEVAHFITDCVYGLRNIRPHGAQWKELMGHFGASASRTFTLDMAGLPQRRMRRYPYHCGCTTHALTARRHNKAQQGAIRYFCRACGDELVSRATASEPCL